jgi:hypothetical protein
MDEFEKGFDKNYTSNAKELLSFLDGATSRNNIIFIACVNDLSRVPSAFMNRPSRFNLVEEIDYADESMIQSYVTEKIPDKYFNKLDPKELCYKLSDAKVTIDQVKAIVLSILCDKKPIDDAIALYKSQSIAQTEED